MLPFETELFSLNQPTKKKISEKMIATLFKKKKKKKDQNLRFLVIIRIIFYNFTKQ